jgi:cytochrome P450
MRRTARRETEIAGRKIREGDKVVMYYGAANRDAAALEDPDRFDPARRPNRHVAFGGGTRTAPVTRKATAQSPRAARLQGAGAQA